MNEANTLIYCNKIESYDWNSLDNYKSCEAYSSHFVKIFKDIFDSSFPVKKIVPNYKNRLPWLTPACSKALAARSG